MINVWGLNPSIVTEQTEGVGKHLKKSQQKSPPKKNSIVNTLLRDSNYIPISSIPDCSSPGLNFTFVSGQLKRKQKPYNNSQHLDEPQPLLPRPRRRAIKHLYHKTPESLKASSQDVVLTIDTRIDSMNELPEGERGSCSLFEGNSSAKHEVSRAMMETYDETDEEDEEDYIKGASPGPGAYNYDTGMLSKRKAFSLFISKASRFQETKKEQLAAKDSSPPHRKPKQKLKDKLRTIPYKKCYPFDSSQPRIVENKVEEIPAPGAYRPRQSIEEDLIRRIQRDFKGKFGNEQERFKPIKLENMGPGYYTIDQPSLDPPNPSPSFISRAKRDLLPKSPKIPGVGTYSIDPIEVKIYQQPPIDNSFGSKTKRFQLPKIKDKFPDAIMDSLSILTQTNLAEFYRKRQQQKLRRLPIPPSTQSKYGQPKIEKIPGPGAYL